MRKRSKSLSLVMAFIFALAFLVPTFGMPGIAAAYPDVSIGDDSGDLKVVTDNADDVKDRKATLQAYVEIDEDDYYDYDYEIYEYGFFYGYDRNEVDEVAEEYLEYGYDGWLCEYEEGDDYDYNDDDEQFEFSLQLRNLDKDEKTLYYRAYIEYYDYDGETFYSVGKRKSLDIDAGYDEPEVTTNNAGSIKSDSAVLNGKLTSFGDDDEITEYGFYYGTTSSPSSKKKVGDYRDDLDEGDTFDLKLSGLKSNTKYYFKAYARNSEGIAYGSVRNFTTAKDKVDVPVVTTTTGVFTIGKNSYLLNGSNQVMDAAPYIKNSRTYMPIRYVGYAMGLTDAQIQWNEASRTVLLTKGNSTVVLIIGSTTMFVNGQARVMDVAPEIINSRTYLPIAWVASAFGHTAVWNGTTQQVTIAGVTAPATSKGELKLSRSSLTLEPGDDAAITGTLNVDIDDVDYDIDGDRVFSVDTRITGTTFRATIDTTRNADDGDEATITFTATDSNGNKYEAEVDVFVEDDSSGEVEVSSNNATSITKNSARLNGKVSDDGGLDIKRLGFYYGTNSREVGKGEDGKADYDRAKGNESKFYFDLKDLDPNTKYYFMAYAVDEDSDITYGKVLDFTTKK